MLSNFSLRLVSAIILISIVFVSFYFGPIGVVILCGLISVLLYSEVLKNFGGYGANKFLLVLAAAGILEALFISDTLFVISLFIFVLIIGSYPKTFRWFRLLSLSYIFISQYLFLTFICGVPSQLNIEQPLFLISIVIASDTGGYIFGNLFGRNKIAPSVSPNKTWEGLFGANFLSLIVWAIIFRGFAENMILEAILVVFLCFCSQMGDLLESYAKRRLSLKDSGGLIPGHGGVFDRMDSLLGAVFGYSLIIALGFGI